MVRVLLSANTSWYLYNFRRSTIESLLSQGCHVMCVSPEDEYATRLKSIGADWTPLRLDSHSLAPSSALRTVADYWKVLRRFRPHVVYTFTPKPNLLLPWLAKSVGARTVANVSGLGSAASRKLISRVMPMAYRIALSPCSQVIVQNARDAADFRKRKIAPENRLLLIPGSGVDLVRFQPAKATPLGLPGERRFLMAARLLREKGVAEYIQAAGEVRAMNPGCTFSLAGWTRDDDDRYMSLPEVRALCERHGVEWLGPVDEIESVLCRSDVVVLPTRYNEGTPKVLIEALAAGRLIVASDLPGCREVTDAGRVGLLFDPVEDGALERSLKVVALLPQADAETMSRLAREHAEKRYDEALCIAPYVACARI